MNIEQKIIEVPIEQIIPNRFQPRLTFEDKGLEELSKSIKEHGIIQPLVLRRIEDKYEIVAGERRYKAATMAGLTKVPAIIADIDDNKSAEVAIVENVQRRDLSAIEEARSYKNLLDKGYLTQTELAKKMGLSQSAIANKLRLLSLDEAVQEALLNNKISERHARSLLVLPNGEEQKRWLDRIINERMTVRQLDSELKKVTNANIEDDEDDSDIPLVKSLDIDTIRKQATELPKVGEESEIARKLREIEREKMYNPDVIPVEQATNKSKGNFFNFLEEEVVNMNTEETKITAPSSFPTFKEDNTIPKENSIASSPSLMSEFTPNNSDEDFDPANLIETLDPNYQKETQKENSNLLPIINEIRNIKTKLSSEGYNISLEESDLTDTYEFVFKIKKN